LALRTAPALPPRIAPPRSYVSGLQPWSSFYFLLCRFGAMRGAVLEAEAVASDFENVAIVGKPIDQRGGHFDIAEDAGPFAEAKIRRDDDAGSFVKFAQ